MIDQFNNKSAIVSHYLQNIDNSISMHYKKDALKIIQQYNIEPSKNENCNMLAENPLQQLLFQIEHVPFPSPKNPTFSFIDLFAGIGGFRIALQKFGGKCVFTSEWEKEAQRTYRVNFGETPFGDITKEDTKKYIPNNFDILCGGFPCQPFSAAGVQKGFDDTRGTLFFDILEILHSKNPKIVLLENVKNLIYHNKGNTFSTMIKHLEELGYNLSWQVLNAKDYGVAQTRERIVIVGTKKEKFDFSKIKKSKNKAAIKDVIDENEKSNWKYLNSNEYILINKEHIKVQDTGLKFIGYRDKPIRSSGVRPNTEHLSRVHRQCNRIYSADGTHPTIASTEISGRHHIYHNGKVRKLTINECFRLMGFPENYIKVSSTADLYRQIGNSVAVPMIEAVVEQIIEQGFI
jgi:DNA (cytosine-5)-methyltransferase 1